MWSIWKPIALFSSLAFSTLGLLAQKYQKARFIFHLTLYAGTLGLMSVWGVTVSLLATLAGQRLNINYIVARSFYYTASPLTGIRLHVEGQEHLDDLVKARNGKGQSAILIGNHQSFMDILYLGRIFPKHASIMAKQELKWSPLLGQYLAASGAVFVDRRNRKNALAAMEKAGEDMKRKGVSLWVFPEGTRSSTSEPKLLPFKKGAFHLAVQAQVPIVAVVCENYHRLFDGKTRMERGELRLKVLPPISTAGLTSEDVTALAESTRDKMLEVLISISHPGPSGSKPLDESGEVDKSKRLTGSSILTEKGSKMVLEQSKQRSEEVDDGSEEVGRTESGSGRSRSGNESTEDEMEGDAVLLKRPKSD